MYRKKINYFFNLAGLLLVMLSYSNSSASETIDALSHTEHLANQPSKQRQDLKSYKFTIHVKTEIPEGLTLLCYVKQIGREVYNLPGKTSEKITKSGEVTLELLQYPEYTRNELFQIRVDNFQTASNNSGINLVSYYSAPFSLDKYNSNDQLEFTVNELKVCKFLGKQKFQTFDLKGREYPKLHVNVTMKESQSSNPVPFVRQLSRIADPDGVFELPLYDNIDFDINTNLKLCLDSRPVYTDGIKDVECVKVDEVSDERFPISLVHGSGKALNVGGTQKLIVDLGPCAVVNVYETIDGKEELCSKVQRIFFESKQVVAGRATITNGRSFVVPIDERLLNAEGGNVMVYFRDEYQHLQNSYKIEPATFRFSSLAKERKIHEVKYLLIPQSSAKFIATDGQTGKPIANARLYLIDTIDNNRSTCHRPNAQIPLAPGKYKAVLFAPGYEIAEVDLAIKKEAINQPFAWKLRPAPEVKIDFAAEGVTEDGKAQLKVGYDKYPFIPPQSFPFDYQRGQGSVTARLDLKRPMTMVVNDLRREMLFPGSVVRHPGGKAPAAIAVKAPAPYVYSGKLKEGVVAETKRPALVFWLPEIPGANATPIGYASVSTDGALAARLAPGVKYRRFLRCPSPDPADKDKSPRVADKYYLLEPFAVPESGAQTEPETVAPGREITRKEAYALICGWVF